MGNSISSIDYEKQLLTYKGFDHSHQVGDAEPNLGFGPIYRAKGYDDLFHGYHPTKDSPPIQTLPELLAVGSKLAGEQSPFLGQRIWKVDPSPTPRSEAELKVLPKTYTPSGYIERKDGSVDRFEYAWISHKEAHDAIVGFGRGLAALGMPLESHAGIFAPNRPEWIIAQHAFYTQKMTLVPLYATLGPNAIEYILNHSELPVVVVSKENFGAVVKAIPSLKATGDCKLKHIIMIDSLFNDRWGNTLDKVNDKQRQVLVNTGIELHNMSDIIALGQSETHKDIPVHAAEPDSLAFIMYTSGTTGNPKGVCTTHKNVCTAIGPVVDVLKDKLVPHHVYFSFLPLPHVFEQVVMTLMVASAIRVAFSQGDIRQLANDLQASQPHIMPGVPRVWSRLYQAAWAGIDQMSFIKRWYIYRAYNYQLNQLRNHQDLDAGYDTKVFAALREKMGLSRITLMITGAAPCPGYLLEFMRVVTNGFFISGFGMSESSAASAISTYGDNLVGHCGPVLPSCDFRLASIPDMGYTYEDEFPRGELLLSGDSIFQGYYKNDEATAEALVKDATGRVWLRTGDVARYNKNCGSISIVDRKKALLKLSQGEYVSLETVENKYGQSPLISQCWVYGNSYKSMLVAIIVPNVMPLYELCVSNGWWKLEDKPIPGQLSDDVIAQFKSIVNQHRGEIEAWMKASLGPCEGTLLGFEKIKAFHIDVDYDRLGLVWTDQNELLTPTMKVRRQPLAKHYIETLKVLYTHLNEPHQDGENWW